MNGTARTTQLAFQRVRGETETGYERQASYQNEKAMVSTLYCICKIALEMKWSQKS